ncbi:LOW QUALITY PROTEIN: hypothetical protein HID58_040148 [Brassica napus]|uniref:Uncharacterized protein n=1 Tax=Brassica napus TaxID=3708 RepID=A0ABQ8B760_BRANA|nr:LOW QUALITY PROTEIN: hypothetical protein HID58_040148 [Brassica napus]
MIKLCAKYCRRGFTSVASSFKHGWEEQNKVVLGFVFMGGWFGQSIISSLNSCMYGCFKHSCNYVLFLVPMREHWLRVHKFLKDEEKRIRGEIYLKRNKGKKKDD